MVKFGLTKERYNQMMGLCNNNEKDARTKDMPFNIKYNRWLNTEENRRSIFKYCEKTANRFN